jgi:hypothetical protein
VWLGIGRRDRFVLLSGKKRWAYPTKGEAITAFILRKRRQESILESRLKDVRAALAVELDDYMDCTDIICN